MNIHEGARRIRVIAMCLLALGIVVVAIEIAAMQVIRPWVGVLNWAAIMGSGFALALLAWVLDGFGKPEKQDPQKALAGPR